MPLFMFCLAQTSPPAAYDRMLDELEARFPDLEFERVWDWSPAINNAIFPVMAEPHPTERGSIPSNIAAADIAEVKAAFAEIVEAMKDWKPS